MKLKNLLSRISLPPALLLLALGMMINPAASACAVCFGRSDSPLAEGMNMGILSLLGVIVGVLGAFTVFFVFLGRRAAGANSNPPSEAPSTVDS
jgi:hypothetical protein